MTDPTSEGAPRTDSVQSFAERLDGWQRVSYAQLLSDIRATFPFGEHIKWGNLAQSLTQQRSATSSRKPWS